MVDFPDELDTSFFARVRQNRCCCITTFPLDLIIILLLPHVAQFRLSLTNSFLLYRSIFKDILMHEELSTYADEVFESPSEAAMKEAEPSSKNDETELTGSALDKTELERSHLML